MKKDKKVVISFTLDNDIVEALKNEAKKCRISTSSLLTLIIIKEKDIKL